jgi:hypothetical protein
VTPVHEYSANPHHCESRTRIVNRACVRRGAHRIDGGSKQVASRCAPLPAQRRKARCRRLLLACAQTIHTALVQIARNTIRARTRAGVALCALTHTQGLQPDANAPEWRRAMDAQQVRRERWRWEQRIGRGNVTEQRDACSGPRARPRAAAGPHMRARTDIRMQMSANRACEMEAKRVRRGRWRCRYT